MNAFRPDRAWKWSRKSVTRTWQDLPLCIFDEQRSPITWPWRSPVTATLSVAASLRVSRSVAARVAVKRRGEIEAWEMTGECGRPLVTDSASTAEADAA